MEDSTKERHVGDGKGPASSELHIEVRRPDRTTYWGVLCRTCRELVALDICPYISFGSGAAGMKPGVIRCARGHKHIYFPRDFGFVDSAVPMTEVSMRENREAYRAINPPPPTSHIRPAASYPEAEMNHRHHVPRTVLASSNARPASAGTYQLSAKPYRTAEGPFKGTLEGVMFLATSPANTQQWFAVNGGQLERDFNALVPHESASQIVAALTRGDAVDFRGPFQQEQFDRGFHYEGSHVHFVLWASTGAGRI